MDQLMYTSELFSHTHDWYEVRMLKLSEKNNPLLKPTRMIQIATKLEIARSNHLRRSKTYRRRDGVFGYENVSIV